MDGARGRGAALVAVATEPKNFLVQGHCGWTPLFQCFGVRSVGTVCAVAPAVGTTVVVFCLSVAFIIAKFRLFWESKLVLL